MAVAAAKDGLAEKVVEASGSLASGRYTPESFAALKRAVDEANAVIDDEYATEARIAAARVELLRASRCLEPVDQAAAEEERARCEAICELAETLTDLHENVDLANYKAGGVPGFRAALAAADGTLENASSTSAELREARASVLLARKALERKDANTLSARGKTVKAKAKKLKKKKAVIKRSRAFEVAGAQGKITFQKVKGNKKISVSKAGKVTVKKGLKKGTYKVQVAITAAGDGDHFSATQKVTVKVRVR